jgi:hypothetical protein
MIFLGMFMKLWEMTVSFIMFVCWYVHKEQLDSYRMDFDDILYLVFFWKSVKKIEASLKSNKNNGYFAWRSFHIYKIMSLNCSYTEKCFRQKS